MIFGFSLESKFRHCPSLGIITQKFHRLYLSPSSGGKGRGRTYSGWTYKGPFSNPTDKPILYCGILIEKSRIYITAVAIFMFSNTFFGLL